MRIGLSIAVLGLVVAAAALQSACTTNRSVGRYQPGVAVAGPTVGRDGWRTYDLGGGGSVALPFIAREEQEQNRLSDGSRVTVRRLALGDGRVNFLVITSEVEGGVGGDLFEFLDGMIDSFLSGAEDMDMVSADAIWHQGYPGSSFELRNDQGRRIAVRQYVGRSRAYTFAIASDMPIRPEDASLETRFFGTIRLAHGDEPSPAGDGRLDYTRFAWIHPPEGGFAAELPGAPSRGEAEVRFEDETYRSYTYTTQNETGTSGMRVTSIEIDASERPESILELLQQRATASGGSVRGVRPAHRQGYGGQAFVVDEPDRIRFVMHILTQGRILEMVHTVPRGDEAGQAENRRRFFNSLRIL